MQEGMPQAEGAPAPEQKVDIGSVIADTAKNLATIVEAAAAGALPPELGQAAEAFGAALAGGAEPKARPAEPGMVDAQAGGNRNARPVGV